MNSSTRLRSMIARLVAVHFWPVYIIAPLIDMRQRMIDIGVGQHDRRILAAQLKLELGSAFRRSVYAAPCQRRLTR